MEKIDCIVIGAGPAGMMCAGTAASFGKKVIIIEKNRIPGRKLLLTGKGRCNVTNNCDKDTFFDNVINNSKFLYSSYSQFDCLDTMNFFEGQGVALKTERGNRVFPVSDKSVDILNALRKYLKETSVDFINGEFKSLVFKDNNLCGIVLKDGRKYDTDNVVIATGGVSYPKTGSTGDGYKVAEYTGHKIIPVRPSLVGIDILQKNVCASLQGLSLKNISVKLLRNNKIIYKDFGEMMFSHFGLTGPVILSMSTVAKTGDNIFIDLKPALSEETLYKRLCSDFEKNNNKNFANSLSDLLPNKLISVIIDMSGIDKYKKVNSITRSERMELVHLLKNFKFTVEKLRPISEAIITAGGVSISDISSGNMMSKKIKGLYFIGEVLDLDAYTGGFNLQIAFSTGYCAGKNIGQDQ